MQLAEVNVARLRGPLDGEEMGGLRKALGDVFWLAERDPGFLWRAQPSGDGDGDRDGDGDVDGDGDGDGPLIYRQLDGQEVVVTLSVWTDFASLQRYVYRTAHGLFMQRRGRWFEPIGGFTTAMWWVADGEWPTVDEGLARIRLLREVGPTPQAFSLRRQFDPEGGRVIV